ncbi:TetR/AcrR family transcriptional regulator [Mycolicibacterium vinylchloridicum]|uniref:TetR/AcrR family transcriptional regulator n=1 Tax=Mycolicibacterium vinylchloridicum TaxID=2736928 RepID=UPI002D7EF99D|nr:TetR/AcrR family transcriptional regulator [Mycolicibacterium vinylchloridicum]
MEATASALGRFGHSKLNLSDVAAQAGISRPTLYTFFASKDELLDAFNTYELELLSAEIAQATDGLTGQARLDAALAVMVDIHQSQRLRRMVDVEPHQVLTQMSRALPVMFELFLPAFQGAVTDPEIATTAAVRIGISHYLVPSHDDGQLLAQLRLATYGSIIAVASSRVVYESDLISGTGVS